MCLTLVSQIQLQQRDINIYLFLTNTYPYFIANQYCRNVSEWINRRDLLYLSLPAVDAVEGFIIGDVIDKYGSMSTSEVTLHIVITHQLAENLALQIIWSLLIPPSQYKHNCTMNVPDLKGANLQNIGEFKIHF